MKLTPKVIDFMIYVLEKGSITKSTQDFYSFPFQYYTMVWYLRDMGILEIDGVDESNQKIWVLTERGKKLARLLKECKRIAEKEDDDG
jgi:predicted transcriptional regulator